MLNIGFFVYTTVFGLINVTLQNIGPSEADWFVLLLSQFLFRYDLYFFVGLVDFVAKSL